MDITITPFEVGEIKLSMRDTDSGKYLTANYYTVDGIYNDDGTLRQLSIGQLVMAICLEQATQLEEEIVVMMQGMANTISKMEVLTGVQEEIINNPDADGNLYLQGHYFDLSQWPGSQYPDPVDWTTTYKFLVEDENGPQCTGVDQNSSAEEIISAVSTALDDLNTINQTETIELESLTKKRDQRYDLISNIVKSFTNTLASVSNNM